MNMGVAGASLATAISKVVSFAILIFPYVTKRSLLRLSVRHFRLNLDILGNIVSVGSSSMFRSGLAVVAGIMLNDMAGDISDSVLAGIGVSTKVMMFPFSIILGFGSGFQPVVGFNWGARRYDRVKQCYDFSAWVAFLGAAGMGLGISLLSDQIVMVFAGTDPEMLKIGSLCIRLQCLALPVHAWVTVVNMLCTGLGNAGFAFILATARQGTCMVPILFPLAQYFAEHGIASVQAVADFLTLILAVPICILMMRKIKIAREGMDIST
jgi:Na+-driven multidrug efflux pump